MRVSGVVQLVKAFPTMKKVFLKLFMWLLKSMLSKPMGGEKL